MAGPYFWVGGSGNTSDATNHWATASGGAPNVANVPTSADNVTFDAASNATAYTVTVDATFNCKDMTWALPGTSGVPTLNNSGFTVSIFGILTLITGQVMGSGGTIKLSATASGKTITSNGVSIKSDFTFNGVGGGWTLQDALAIDSNHNLTVTNGTLNTNAKTCSAGGFISNGGTLTATGSTMTFPSFVSTSGTRTLTLAGSTINITSAVAGTPWNIASVGLTFSAAGSTINVNVGATNNLFLLTMAGLTYGTLNITAPGQWQIGGGPTFKNLSYTSTTDKRDQFLITGSISIAASGSLAIAGNSSVNRAFFRSSTLGSSATISVPNTATVSLANVDIQDLSASGTFGTWTGTSLGDCLGNSGITFDASVSLTLASTGVIAWSTATWTGTTNRVPLPQDDVSLGNSATATTLASDMPRLGRNIDASGFLKTWTFSAISNSLFGNLTLGSGITSMTGTQGLTLQGRGSQTITSAGKTFPQAVTVAAFGGTYTLQDAFVSGGTLTTSAGTLDSGDNNVTAVTFSLGSPSTIKGTALSKWSSAATSGVIWNAGAGLTTTNFLATIAYTGNVSTTATFAGNGRTYGALFWSSTTSTGTLIITGANSFAALQTDNTTARKWQFPNGVTQTVAPGGFQLNGKAGVAISIVSDSAGHPATLSCAGGDCQQTYLTIQDITATGGANWRDVHGIGGAGNDGNVSGNTGWTFGNVSVSNSATLAVGVAQTGAARSSRFAAGSLPARAAQSGIIVSTSAQHGSLGATATIAGTPRSAASASANLVAGARLSAALRRSLLASSALQSAAGMSGIIMERIEATPELLGNGQSPILLAGTYSPPSLKGNVTR